ncbi:MAG: hypothetical protein WBI06_06220 [Paludibacter sp.]
MELLPLVVTVGSSIQKLPESEFRHPVSIPVAGNGVPIRDDRTPIREAGVLFGMTEFRLRQYSPIQSISVAGIGITPFGRDRWFRHPAGTDDIFFK